jgi:hypothetical protein
VSDAAALNVSVMRNLDQKRIITPMTEELLARIDDYRFTRRKRSRVEAVLDLLEQSLVANGILEPSQPPPAPKQALAKAQRKAKR